MPTKHKRESDCRNCTNRHPACHDECESYKAFKEYRAELLKKKGEIYALTDYRPKLEIHKNRCSDLSPFKQHKYR